MTSGELLNKRFEKARVGGYRTTEVETFLAEAATAFAQLTRENNDLKRQLEVLRGQTAEVEADKDSLRDALLSAQKFADSLVNNAKKQADELLEEARAKADRLTGSVQIQITHEKEELTRIKTEVASFRSHLLDVYRAHLELIGAMPVETKEDPADAQQSEQTTGASPLKDDGNGLETASETEKPSSNDVAYAQAAAAEAPVEDVPTEKIQTDSDINRAPKPAHIVPVRLNMRFDEQTGEYVPLSTDRMQDKE